MSHDKIRAATRKRMAETGEPYATARREVIKDYQHAGAGPGVTSSFDARFFAIDYSDMGRVSLPDGDTAWRGTGTRRRGGRPHRAAGADGWFPPGHPSQRGAIGRPLCALGPGNASGYMAAAGAGS